MTDPLAYYSTPGHMTDPRRFTEWLDGLPSDIPSLCRTVQGLLVHIFWAERYGLQLSEERKQEVNVRSLARKLECIHGLDGRPLTAGRPLDKRMVGNCRDFSVTLTGILRRQGVPARARCGFGTYFLPNHYEDHWVCEYWKADEGRWVMVDAQLDTFQCRELGIDFDPCDMPPGRFVPAGSAWQLCRSGQANPDNFGIFDMRGLWFIRGNLGRDFAALNKMELLPWDCWGIVDKHDPQVTTEDMALLDRTAELTLSDNRAFDQVRGLYESEERLHVPPVISSYPGGPPLQVQIEGE